MGVDTVRRGLGLAWALVVVALAVTARGAEPDKAKPEPDKAKTKTEPAKAKLGLHVNDPKAYQGYTLMSPLMSNTTYLLDMQGRVVRTWKAGSTPGCCAYLLENGHILRPFTVRDHPFGGGPGAGGGVQEFTWDGEVVWDFKLPGDDRQQHHDVCRLPNGNVLMIVWEKKTAKEALAAGRRPETVKESNLHPDCILEVQPTGKTTGKIVWEWHAWDHLIQDFDSTKTNYGDVGAHPELIDVNFGEGVLAAMVAKPDELAKLRAIGYVGAAGRKAGPVRADWMHANGLAYNADLDQIMVSVHEFSEFWIIDHSTTTAQAAGHSGGRYGKGGDLLYRWGNPRAYRAGTVKDQKLFSQHNAQWIPKGLPGEGHVLVFNNGTRRPGGAYSTVDELVLPLESDGHYARTPGAAYGPDKPVWSYAAPKRTDFFSSFISGVQRLPNGNTLICSGANGTFLEVTPDKEIVWKYVNPEKPSAPMPGSGRTPPLVDLLPGFLRDRLKLTDAQKKELDGMKKDAEAKLNALLTDEQQKRLKEPPGGGPPGFQFGPPQTVQILPSFLQGSLKLTDDQKKDLDALRKDVEGKVVKLLTVEQQKQLKEARNTFTGPPGGGPPPGFGGPGAGAAVFRVYRYDPAYPGLAGKDLKPGKTVEEMQAKEPPKDASKEATGK